VVFFVVLMVFSVGVFAESGEVREEILDFVEGRGIVVGEENVTEVSFEDLPEEVDIEVVDNTSIVIYQVDYDVKPLFVIASGELQGAVSEVVLEARSLLHFGFAEEMPGSGFLNMASGVEGSLEKGYVMMRSGSVTGISTNLDVVSGVGGEGVEIVIYRNGEEVGFRNVLSAESSGVKIDYDVLSKGIVGFEAGDVISVYLSSGDGVSLTDVTTTIEVTS